MNDFVQRQPSFESIDTSLFHREHLPGGPCWAFPRTAGAATSSVRPAGGDGHCRRGWTWRFDFNFIVSGTNSHPPAFRDFVSGLGDNR